MAYLLPDSFLKDLLNLRVDYENSTQINLSTSPQPNKFTCFFGATDIKARDKEIRFVESMLVYLKSKLSENNQFKNQQELHEHISALRVLLACVFYIKKDVDKHYWVRSGHKSKIVRLLDNALKLSGKNSIDEETRSCALLSAQRFIFDTPLEKINKLLSEDKNASFTKEISELEWRHFSRFIHKQCKSLDKSYECYPITAVMVPLVGLPLEAAGYTVGWLAGEIASKTTTLIPAHLHMTAAVGGGLFMLMGPPSSVGIMLMAPTYASQLLRTFMGVSLACVLGRTMGFLGRQVGWAAGMSADLTWKLFYQACCLLAYACKDGKPLPRLTGYNIINGQRIFDGIEVNIVELNQDENELQPHFKSELHDFEQIPFQLEATDEGLLVKIGDDVETVPWESIQEKQPYLEKLQSILEEYNHWQETDEDEIADCKNRLEGSGELATHTETQALAI